MQMALSGRQLDIGPGGIADNSADRGLSGSDLRRFWKWLENDIRTGGGTSPSISAGGVADRAFRG
jgi:hypothetical protein